MKIHHLRNATFIIESESNFILIDPMLSDKGELPSFARFRHRPAKNPTVELPANAQKLLAKVSYCLITHSQTFGIKALQHTDHLDASGEAFLRDKDIPVACRQQDAPYLRKYGIRVIKELQYWKPAAFDAGIVTAVPAQHGHGWIHRLMANGAGFFLQLAGEPSIYISGDTVYTPEVERALKEFQPDIAVMAAGNASLDVGGPILMPLQELITFARTAPKKVIANHLEALNHCPMTRSLLQQKLNENKLMAKTSIPNDGETLVFEVA